MSKEKAVVEDVDRIVHEPARLSILTFLASSPGASAGFTELKEALGMSSGNLSVQLKNLEEAGYLTISKSFRGAKPYTEASVTSKGEAALTGYIARMESMIAVLKAKLGS